MVLLFYFRQLEFLNRIFWDQFIFLHVTLAGGSWPLYPIFGMDVFSLLTESRWQIHKYYCHKKMWITFPFYKKSKPVVYRIHQEEKVFEMDIFRLKNSSVFCETWMHLHHTSPHRDTRVEDSQSDCFNISLQLPFKM